MTTTARFASVWCVVLGAASIVAADVSPAITVYNQDFAVVKATRPFDMPAGRSSLTLKDVAARIDPTSVQFTCLTDPTCRVVEQNFDYDLVGVEKLLAKMIDRRIELVDREGKLFAGTLLAYENQNLTLADRGITIFPLGDDFQQLRLPELPAELLLEPTLVWQVERKQSGPATVEVAYQTAGVTWRADYNVLVRPADKHIDVNAWVTITNTSGAAYPESALKLVAGDVHKVKEEEPVVSRRKMDVLTEAKAMAPPPGFEERQFAEYHLYELGRKTSLKDNQTKQIELFNAHNVAYTTAYQFGPPRPVWRGRHVSGEQPAPLDVVLTVWNKKENQLGIPLPAGTVRLYQRDDQGDQHYLGEDTIDHTPKDEKVRLRVAKSFDVVGSRKQLSHKRISRHVHTEEYLIRVRNHKARAVPVHVVETLRGGLNWTIEKPNVDYTKKDFRTIEFNLSVPANSEKKIRYRVRYERYTW